MSNNCNAKRADPALAPSRQKTGSSTHGLHYNLCELEIEKWREKSDSFIQASNRLDHKLTHAVTINFNDKTTNKLLGKGKNPANSFGIWIGKTLAPIYKKYGLPFVWLAVLDYRIAKPLSMTSPASINPRHRLHGQSAIHLPADPKARAAIEAAICRSTGCTVAELHEPQCNSPVNLQPIDPQRCYNNKYGLAGWVEYSSRDFARLAHDLDNLRHMTGKHQAAFCPVAASQTLRRLAKNR